MKKSNKLLLLIGLAPLILLGLIHLNLYARYKAGNFVTEKELHEEQYARKELPAPVYLSIKGVKYITIIPSDTFAVEYNKQYIRNRERFVRREAVLLKEGPAAADTSALYYYRRGDTLEIVGYDTLHLKRLLAENQPPPSFPGITLYCRGIRTMAFEGAHITVQQETKPALGPGGSLVLLDSDCSLGEPDRDTLGPLPYFYDDLRVKAVHSELNLNPNAVFRDLSVELDSVSGIDDHAAKIGNLGIQYADRSRIQLSGANLRKIQIRP